MCVNNSAAVIVVGNDMKLKLTSDNAANVTDEHTKEENKYTGNETKRNGFDVFLFRCY